MSETVAIIGASRDRAKYGNKAVRAYAAQGYTVYPVNPREEEVEGLRAYASVRDIPGPIGRASIYLPPERTLAVLDDIAAKGVGEVFFNPGTENDEVFAKADRLGLKWVAACSIVAIGESPGTYA